MESFRIATNKCSISDFARHECESEEEIEGHETARKLISSADCNQGSGKGKAKWYKSRKFNENAENEKEEESKVPEFIAKRMIAKS